MRFLDWLTGKVRGLPARQLACPAAGTWTMPPRRLPERVQDLPMGFVRLDFAGGECAILDRDMYAYTYGERHLPDPSQRDLDAMMRRATRVRVLAAGVMAGEAMRSSVLLDTTEPSALEELGSCLQIRDELESFGHCGCRGGPTVQLFAGAAHLATIGLQHGEAIRWNAWHHDATLRDGARLSAWLERKGVYRPLLDQLYQNPLPWSGGLDLEATTAPLSLTRQKLLLARILLRKGEHAGALATCDALVAEQPGLGAAYLMRAMVHRRMGDLDASLANCHKAIELLSREDRATGYIERAGVYSDLKRHEEAIADCSASIAINPENPQALNFRGALHMVSGRHADAQADLTAASALAPAWADPTYNRAIVALCQADWTTVVEFATRAIALIKADEAPPDREELAVMFGARSVALEKLGDVAGAETDRHEALVLNPSFDPGIWSATPRYR
jgi:tetratricopeptide (TPR) repeat protein